MNKTLTIAAIVMFAVVIGMSTITPAMAAKVSKTLVCTHDVQKDVWNTISIPTDQVAKYILGHETERFVIGSPGHPTCPP